MKGSGAAPPFRPPIGMADVSEAEAATEVRAGCGSLSERCDMLWQDCALVGE